MSVCNHSEGFCPSGICFKCNFHYTEIINNRSEEIKTLKGQLKRTPFNKEELKKDVGKMLKYTKPYADIITKQRKLLIEAREIIERYLIRLPPIANEFLKKTKDLNDTPK